MTDARRAARAEQIRVARARWDLDQAEVADLAGVNQATVSKAEAGRGSDATYDAIDAAFDRLEAEKQERVP
jgi:predicted transcriptional regulator